MKKIDRLFRDFSELKVIEEWIRSQVKTKTENRIKNLFKSYCIRKPKKFDQMKDILNNSQDPMKRFGASLYIEATHSGNSFCDYLNKCFSKLKNKKGFNALLKRLKRNPEEFNDVLSEIEFNAYFSQRYNMELEPKIQNKKLDSKINLDGRYILFEIFTPAPYKPLQNSKKAILIPNTSKNKILDKLRKQIIPIKDSIKEPLIIVINASISVIDEYDIANSLFGELRLNILHDKKTGKMVGEYWDRDKNSLSDVEPMTELITGILFYRRNIYIKEIEFKKELILNENSKYPLTPKEFNKINRFNLNKIIS